MKGPRARWVGMVGQALVDLTAKYLSLVATTPGWSPSAKAGRTSTTVLSGASLSPGHQKSALRCRVPGI